MKNLPVTSFYKLVDTVAKYYYARAIRAASQYGFFLHIVLFFHQLPRNQAVMIPHSYCEGDRVGSHDDVARVVADSRDSA